MTFTLNDIDLWMTWNFEKALVKYNYVVQFCKFYNNFIDLTLTLIQ